MKRLLQHLRKIAASPSGAAGLLLLALAGNAAAQTNYCNNPVPPCDPNDPKSACYKPPDPSPKCEPIECGKCTKSPCYVGSGVYSFSSPDLEVRTTGFAIAVSRLYQSTHVIDGESGYGWVSSLSARLYHATFLKAAPDVYQREADVRLPNGSTYRFVEGVDGTYTPPAGRFDELVRNPDGTWDLRPQRTRARFHFDATGRLVSISDNFGNTQIWTYIGDRLQSIADASGSGRHIDVTYGANGRISDITDLAGRNIHYAYDARGVMVQATNPQGQTTSYSYVPGKYAPLLSSVSDHWGRNITTVAYDAQDRAISYTDRGETYTYTYGTSTTSKRDSAGHAWQHAFGADGLVTGSTPPDGSPAEQVSYTANGLVEMTTDSFGVKTFFTYDARGNPRTITLDYQGPSAVEWRFEYSTEFPDQIVSMKAFDPITNLVHPHWQGSKATYYPSGSVAPGALHHIEALASDGTTPHLYGSFTYDGQGRMLTYTDAAGSVYSSTYDSAGNLEAITLPANNADGTRPVRRYTYDVLGRVTSMTDPEGNVTSYARDDLDRLTSITLPKPEAGSSLQFTTTYVHDEYDSASGLLFTRVIDANGRESRYGYDQWAQDVLFVDASGATTSRTFTNGLLMSQSDANGYVATYGYDSKGRLTTTTFPDGTSESIVYNADDTIASKRDRLNRMTTYVYDRLKRVAETAKPDGTSASLTYQGQKLVEVRSTAGASSDAMALVWDELFRLRSETQGARGSVTYTYTPAGDAATVTVSGGAVTTYGYYPDRTIRSISWSAVAGSFAYDYTLSGRPRHLTFPNGQTRSFEYDRQGRLTEVANRTASGVMLAGFRYGYDIDPFTGLATALGLRSTITADVPHAGLQQAVTKLGYDARGHLTRADYPPTSPFGALSAAWQYDAAGHRISATDGGVTTPYTYDKFGGNSLNSPQMLSDGPNTYTYDGEGNVTARSGVRGNYTFAWNERNALISVAGDVTVAYAYDEQGRRISQTKNGSATSYIYAGSDLIAERGSSAADYLYGPGIDEPLAMRRDGQLYYYIVDGVGSVVALGDDSATIRNSYVWDVWGSLLHRNESVANPFGYTGREISDAGLHYYRFRVYEPATGRFISEDPLQELISIQGADLYAYVKSSPVMYVDPYGLHHRPPKPSNVCITYGAPSPWRVEDVVTTDLDWVLINQRDIPQVPIIPYLAQRVLPSFTWLAPATAPPTQYSPVIYQCYWRKYVETVEHLARTVTWYRVCTCPPSNTRLGNTIESRNKVRRKHTETEVTTSYWTPCALSPPQ